MLKQVTHTRYEEKKETEVGDVDRELSCLPGPAGSTGNKMPPPPETFPVLGIMFEIQNNTAMHAEVRGHKHLHDIFQNNMRTLKPKRF